MGEQHENENGRTGTKNQHQQKKKKKKSEFEFCKACNINHDQGLRHKYFPNHKKSLSTFLSRFRKKLSDVRFFLNAPIPLNPQLASRNRFWCVFCDQHIDELNSSFACANAIRHLASAEHVKNLKQFFWKYGGAADQLDAFMVSDDDVDKWEKKCTARKDEASEGSRRTVIGPSSDDIHSGNVDSFEKNVYSNSLKSYPSNAVLPLQSYTNEYQVSCSGLSGVATGATSSEVCSGANNFSLQDFAVGRSSLSLPHDGRQRSSNGYSCNKKNIRTHWLVNSLVRENGRMVSGESSHQGVQMVTQISTGSAGGKVFSEEPPPWLGTTDEVQMRSSNKLGKSKKLNSKRVGAAWVEKRKIEMEKERRGESIRNECDSNWLPNFGRVWQSGSRRESRKEFEREKQKLNVETQSEMAIKIKPYVSKRMRMDSGGDYASG
ncbi:TITAN-like protein isoform X1 [Glycine max]|uniref:TITAN-like protein isoform X1 n=1 Tax=Glycine max TaxID=3847 RepID=UPI000719217A|nr:TITAN-like protein isoform X1 [Glycine max]|eukprot:XP_014632002.1 TITAN-like protein isoform X1 [Glycine max]